MASVARVGEDAATLGGALPPRRVRDEARGVAGLRALVDRSCERSLSTLIETEIIPRLMAAHATGGRVPPAGAGDATIAGQEIAALADLALQTEADAVLVHVERVLARGVSVETAMVDLLAPAARLLGEYWEEDRCDFVDVTMGLWRLQEVVHDLAARAPADRLRAAGGHRALFAS